MMLAVSWLYKNQLKGILSSSKIKNLLFSGLILLGFTMFAVFPMTGVKEISSEKIILRLVL